MKIVYIAILVFFFVQQQQTNAASVRKRPAYSTPIYSDAYLPAAMQVIFHAVGQLKNLQSEEIEEGSSSTTTTTTKIPATSHHPPGQHQPAMTVPEGLTDSTVFAIASTTLPTLVKTSDQVSGVVTYEKTENPSEANVQGVDVPTEIVGAETPEENYATPETNHEIREPVQEIQESVHEMAETSHEMAERAEDYATTLSSVGNGNGFDIKATVSLPKEENSGETSSEESDEKSSESESSEESEQKELDSSEEEDEETRFTMIGEKVSQVPRPSLSSYLRKTIKSPLSRSVEELAALYDALSKDARRQGLAKYSGYSDEILKTLEVSSEGGIGPQLRCLLEKVLERKELTRDDAKTKLSSVLKKLNDPASNLNADLRRLIPLRYVP